LSTTASGQPERPLRQALFLEYLTIGWNVVEAAVAIIAGLWAGSIALVGFGLDSIIEVTAAGMLVWRLRCELTCRHRTHERAEKIVLRVIGITFFILAAYVLYKAGDMLLHAQAPEASRVGIVLAVLAAVLSPWLALRKQALARQLNSRALAADALETFACGYLSITLLIGIALNATLGWWWADPAAALLMVPVLLWSGWVSLQESS